MDNLQVNNYSDKTRQDKTRQDNCSQYQLLCQYTCAVCKDDHNGHFVRTEFATLEEIGLKVAHAITTHEVTFSVHHGNMVIEKWTKKK